MTDYIKPVFDKDYKIKNIKEVKAAVVSSISPKYKVTMQSIDHPKTMQDKVNWLKIYDVTPEKGRCADKIAVHDYSVERLGRDICVPIIKVYNSPDEIKLSELPDKFVLKCNHGYDMNIIGDKNMNLAKAKKDLKTWLATDFGLKSKQYHYSFIKPKCYAETFIMDEEGVEGLTDYKVWCFNGEPGFMAVMRDRFSDAHYCNIYDLNWNLLKTGYDKWPDRHDLPDPKPKFFDEVIDCARKLSAGFKFVRVDFYQTHDRYYLGEMTFTPSNGKFSFDESFGNPWAAKIK